MGEEITSERLRSSKAGLGQIGPAFKQEVTGLHLDLQLKHPVVAPQVGLGFQVLGVPEGRVDDLEESDSPGAAAGQPHGFMYE